MMLADAANDVRRVLRVLATERKRFYFVVFLCALGGMVELVGVGTLYPFLSLLAKPELIETNQTLQYLYQSGNFQSVEQFMLLSGWTALVVFFCASLFLFLKNAYITRFCVGQTARVSVRVLTAYLRKPLLFHTGSNSGALSKDVVAQSDHFTFGVLFSMMALLGDGAILVVLVGLILWVDPIVGLVITITLGSILSMSLILTRNKMHELGIRLDNASGARFVFCMSALQSIKEIKTTGKETFFADLFRAPANEQARSYARLYVIQMVPQAITQFVAAAAIICMALYYIASGAQLSSIVPTLMIYAVAGYRLMPSVGKVAGALSQLRQFQPVISNISSVLDEDSVADDASARSAQPQTACESIEFRGIAFAYPEAEKNLFDEFSLTINGNTSVCLVGTSGSGKTTIVDLLLGLLPPARGDIRINGKSKHELNDKIWHEMFGYVPQMVYITDGTIAENIAFGIPQNEVNAQRLREVVALCHLEDFVGTQADGLNTAVGERGSKLSGGQRQRIGIARALYRNPPILILDESTSSLDGINERAIIQTLLELRKTKTVISIAHRGSLIKHCDRIVLIDQGKVAADGNFEQLRGSSELFTSLMSEMEVKAA